MDRIATYVERVQAVDPADPPADRTAVEAAVLRHCEIIGFEEPAVHWLEGPSDANEQLLGIDWETTYARKWYLTVQALNDAGTLKIQDRGTEARERFRRAQSAARAHIEDLLKRSAPWPLPTCGLDEGLLEVMHPMSILLPAALRDMSVTDVVESRNYERYAECWPPFFDAYCAGLGAFWATGEDVICLPLPAMTLQNGILHGEDRPAVDWPDGESYWFRNGKRVGAGE